MISQREDKSHYFESAVFIVLFFLFTGAFTEKSDASFGKTFQLNSISFSELLSQVTALNNAQQVPCQKTIVPFFEKADFNLLSDSYKIIAINRTIHQHILFLTKAEISIKPVLLQRFFYTYHAFESDDPPLLS